MASLQELLEQQRDVERRIREAQSLLRSAVLSEIRKIMDENGLTVADLASPAPGAKKKPRTSAAGRVVAPKYRHPITGATWSGRGLKPRWLSDELANGKSKEDFTI